MTTIFSSQVDSIDTNSSSIIVGLSNLEGNIWDGAIKILSLTSGLEEVSCPTSAGISMCRFSGLGNEKSLVLTARDDGNVYLYSSQNLQELRVIAAHDDIVSSVIDDNSNESQFATCGWDGDICIWDWKSNNQAQSEPLYAIRRGHYGQVNDISFNSNNSSSLCSVGQDGFLRLWDRRTSTSSNDCTHVYDIGQAGSCVLWEPENEYSIAVGTDSGEILVIDCRKANTSSLTIKHSTHKGRVRRIIANVDRPGMLLSSSDDTTVALVRKNINSTGNKMYEEGRLAVHSDYVTDISWISGNNNNEGDVIFTCSSDKSIQRSTISI
jgi:WD40 repeat protein